MSRISLPRARTWPPENFGAAAEMERSGSRRSSGPVAPASPWGTNSPSATTTHQILHKFCRFILCRFKTLLESTVLVRNSSGIPDDSSWKELCEKLGVRLARPGAFEQAIDTG